VVAHIWVRINFLAKLTFLPHSKWKNWRSLLGLI